MNTWVILLRGINVGGKNKLPMAALRECLADLGFEDVVTYIQSGNVVLRSELGAGEIQQLIERELPKRFELDSELIKVLAISAQQLAEVIERRPEGFGDSPDEFHSDVIFLIDTPADEAFAAFSPREGVDRVWVGDGVIYSQRLSAQRTKSRLNKIMASKHYKSMTIRNWNTTLKLRALTEPE